MKKLYFIVPIVLLGIFIFFYFNARNGIQEAERIRVEKQRIEKEERDRKEVEARKKAWDIANEEANRQIAAFNARKAHEAEQAQQTEAAAAERNIAVRERDTLSKQVLNLKENLSNIQEQKAKIEEQLKIQKTQVDYLKAAAKEVVQTRSSFQTALDKLQAAEDAFVRAQQAATAAAAAQRKAN